MTETAEKNFIDQFCHTFAMWSYGNQLYGRLVAHILLGQKLKNLKIYFGPFYIDPRISLFLIQPSGTGKSVPYTFIKEVGEKSQLKVDDIDEATDAAMIGHVDAEEVIDPETRTKQIIYNTVKGKLSESDILHYDEGQMLIKRGPHAENALAWFQKALNPIGSGQNQCVKYLAHGEINFYPTCSLLITSHEIENLMEVVLNTGFFQRIVLYPRYIPIIDREKNEFLRADRFGKRIFTEIDSDTLAAKLVEVGKKYEKYELQVDDNVYPVIKSKVAELYTLVETAHERVREIMATFVPRYDNLVYVLSLHHMCAEMKDKIDVEDIKYGASLSYLLFKEVMSWVEENISLSRLSSKESSYLTSAFTIYKSIEQTPEGYVMKVSFIKTCSTKWRISMPTVVRYIERFKGLGKIKEIDQNGVKYLKMEI
jgi:hypothetical protein